MFLRVLLNEGIGNTEMNKKRKKMERFGEDVRKDPLMLRLNISVLTAPSRKRKLRLCSANLDYVSILIRERKTQSFRFYSNPAIVAFLWNWRKAFIKNPLNCKKTSAINPPKKITIYKRDFKQDSRCKRSNKSVVYSASSSVLAKI